MAQLKVENGVWVNNCKIPGRLSERRSCPGGSAGRARGRNPRRGRTWEHPSAGSIQEPVFGAVPSGAARCFGYHALKGGGSLQGPVATSCPSPAPGQQTLEVHGGDGDSPASGLVEVGRKGPLGPLGVSSSKVPPPRPSPPVPRHHPSSWDEQSPDALVTPNGSDFS